MGRARSSTRAQSCCVRPLTRRTYRRIERGASLIQQASARTIGRLHRLSDTAGMQIARVWHLSCRVLRHFARPEPALRWRLKEVEEQIAL